VARVMVYRPASVWNHQKGEPETPPFYGAREGLKLASLKPIEGSGIEVDERELDGNGFYRLKT
jgi:hypothetical protein